MVNYGTSIGTVKVTGTPAAGSTLVASDATDAAWGPGMARQAGTAAAGVALINGTQTILSWTPPNDGLLHRVTVFGEADCATSPSGGAVNLNYTDPAGNANTTSILPGSPSNGVQSFNTKMPVVKAGSAVTLTQDSALTVGTVTVWAELWGS